MEVGGNSFHDRRVSTIVHPKKNRIERSSPWKRSFRRRGEGREGRLVGRKSEGIAKEESEKKWKRGRTRIGISIGGSR